MQIMKLLFQKHMRNENLLKNDGKRKRENAGNEKINNHEKGTVQDRVQSRWLTAGKNFGGSVFHRGLEIITGAFCLRFLVALCVLFAICGLGRIFFYRAKVAHQQRAFCLGGANQSAVIAKTEGFEGFCRVFARCLVAMQGFDGAIKHAVCVLNNNNGNHQTDKGEEKNDADGEICTAKIF